MSAGPAAALEHAAADRALMDRVLREVGARPEAPDPAVLEYLRNLARWVLERMGNALDLAFKTVAVDRVAQWLAAITLLAALGAVLWLLVRRRHRPAETRPEIAAAAAAEPPHSPWDESRWKTELERLLAAGDARGALAALWWWMARALAAERAQPTWTSQELIRHAGRGDLAPMAVAVDRLAYGPRAPQPADVAHLYARLAGAIA
jgi:hypothetical protein